MFIKKDIKMNSREKLNEELWRMIGIQKLNIGSIPTLIIQDHTMEANPLPIVTYFHGFTSAKEQNLPLAYMLAEKGFRVLLPDSIHHGERDNTLSSQQRQLAFWNIVLQNLQDLLHIKTYLSREGLLLDERFGVAGTSMGGITTSAAMTQFPWIKAAAVLMGTPRITAYAKQLMNHFTSEGPLPMSEEAIQQLFRELERIDLSLQQETLANRPLLFWHGDADKVVPFDQSYSFYQEVREQYPDRKNVRFIKEVNRDHKVSRFAMQETTKWFEHFLLQDSKANHLKKA